MTKSGITLEHLTKIEGHATLKLQVDGGRVKRCELSSVEGSRYFEGILKGRNGLEAPEITSRICGICSCSHTLASIQAIENSLDILPTEQTQRMRELLAIGERIRSHATHLYILTLPDYVGHESVFTMLPKYKPEIDRALRMMHAGNELVRIIGGRDLHPVTAAVGGFTHVPGDASLKQLIAEFKSIEKDAIATAKLFGDLEPPDFHRDTQYLSLYDGRKYPVLAGRLKLGDIVFEQNDFTKYLSEYHEKRSTANFVVKEGRAYMTGALARMNNNSQFLTQTAKNAVKSSGIPFPNHNPFHNNFAQAVELVHYVGHAIEECGKLIGTSAEPVYKPDYAEGHGISAIEAPRGVLWHEYTVDSKGIISYANIVTPTAQNLRNMEEDIRAYLPSILRKPRDEIVLDIEKLIRSYDPCFSCSTHFLKVKWLNPLKTSGNSD